jgi:hypothetical protein
MVTFRNGDEVRLIHHISTPSQRRELWIVDGDAGLSHVWLHRKSDPDCIIGAPRSWVAHSTLLDLFVANIDESEADAHDS